MTAYVLRLQAEPYPVATVYLPIEKIIYDVKLVERKLTHLCRVNFDGKVLNVESQESKQMLKLYQRVHLEIELRPYHDEIHRKIRVQIKNAL